MSWEKQIFKSLRSSDIDMIAYLPDSILDGLIERCVESSEFTTVRVAREEEAICLLGGAWLGGNRGALICQSSGLANCFNAIGSHAKPAQLPFLALVTRRGDLGEHNLAQVPAGYGLPEMLEAVGVRYNHVRSDDDVGQRVELAADTAYDTHDPYTLLLERTLTGGKE